MSCRFGRERDPDRVLTGRRLSEYAAGPTEIDPQTAATHASVRDVLANDSVDMAVAGSQVWTAYQGSQQRQRVIDGSGR
jgi:hypothetical protein